MAAEKFEPLIDSKKAMELLGADNAKIENSCGARLCDANKKLGGILRPVDWRTSIYFLVSGDRRIVYVGQTENLHSRIKEHKRSKAGLFCDAYYFPVPRVSLGASHIESALIKVLGPKLNTLMTGNYLSNAEMSALRAIGYKGYEDYE